MTRDNLRAALSVLARDPRHEHAPRTPAELRCALAELRSRGYTQRQIAAALGCSAEAVEDLLGGDRVHE
jgi:DNA-binding CsgD family transcriptional regulator